MRQFKNITIKQYNCNSGVTLVELLISLCIFSVIVIGFSSIETASRYHVIASDKRAKLQNDASYVLEHMAKEISKAVGGVSQSPINITNGGTTITIRIDSNPNGRLDGADIQIAYEYLGVPNYEMRYYPNYGNPASYDILSRRFSAFNCSQTDNYINVTIDACWNPAVACNTPDNPGLVMRNHIYMPAVSTH